MREKKFSPYLFHVSQELHGGPGSANAASDQAQDAEEGAGAGAHAQQEDTTLNDVAQPFITSVHIGYT